MERLISEAGSGYGGEESAYKLEIFAGADNLFNTKYSLGNDINAAAGRYYNAAAGVNYFAGISLSNLFH